MDDEKFVLPFPYVRSSVDRSPPPGRSHDAGGIAFGIVESVPSPRTTRSGTFRESSPAWVVVGPFRGSVRPDRRFGAASGRRKRAPGARHQERRRISFAAVAWPGYSAQCRYLAGRTRQPAEGSGSNPLEPAPACWVIAPTLIW